MPDAASKLILTTKTWIIEGDNKDDDGKPMWLYADIDWTTPDLIGEYVAGGYRQLHPELSPSKLPKPKTTYYASTYIVADDQFKSNEKRVMILPFTKAVYDEIVEARTGRKPFEPFNVRTGADFFYERDSSKGTKTYNGCKFDSPSDFTQVVPLDKLVEQLPVLDKDVKRLSEEEQREALTRAFSNYSA